MENYKKLQDNFTVQNLQILMYSSEYRRCVDFFSSAIFLDHWLSQFSKNKSNRFILPLVNELGMVQHGKKST